MKTNSIASVAMVVVLVLGLSLVMGCTPSSRDVFGPSIEGTDESQITTTSAVITWNTDEPASSQVEYGLTETYGSVTPLDSSLTTTHSVTLGGLTPSTDYHYRVVSTDEAGNTTESFGWFFTTLTHFVLTGSQLTNGTYQVKLRLQFTATDSVSFSLTNPDGIEVGTGYADKNVTAQDLGMAGYLETPKAGTYILTVTHGLDQLSTSSFEYQAANAVASNLALTWTYSEYSQYTLTNVSFKVTNTGGLPVCIDEGQFTIGGQTETLYVSLIIMPGETKTITESVYDYGISAGQKTFTLTLKDGKDAVVVTYTASVTPQ